MDTVFGLPGDGINGIMEGFRRHDDRIRFVLVHHEEAAAFMATAYAKTTGRLGVCLATSGPGGLHLINGLYDAKLDHVPVLAITGMQATSQLGTGYQQEVHLERLFMDLCVYNEMFHAPASIPALVDIAVRSALSKKGALEELDVSPRIHKNPQRAVDRAVRLRGRAGNVAHPRDVGRVQRAAGGPQGSGPPAGRGRAERGGEGGHAGRDRGAGGRR